MHATERQRLIVGALMLLLGLVGPGVILVLGDRVSVGGLHLTITYKRVANLKAGATVRLLGRRIGRVLTVQEVRRPGGLARVRVHVYGELAKQIWRNSRAYISATSIVGERYVDIAPPRGAPGKPLPDGATLRGVDPPDLDAFFNRTYAVVTKVFALAAREGPTAKRLIAHISSLRQTLADLRLRQRVVPLVARLIVAVRDVRALLATFNRATNRGRDIKRLSARARRLIGRTTARLSTLGKRVGGVSQRLSAVAKLVGPAQRRRLAKLGKRFAATQKRIDGARADLRTVFSRLTGGRGTLGRILNDRELSDDLKRASKDLKERPWRVLGKPPRNQAPRGVRRRPQGR